MEEDSQRDESGPRGSQGSNRGRSNKPHLTLSNISQSSRLFQSQISTRTGSLPPCKAGYFKAPYLTCWPIVRFPSQIVSASWACAEAEQTHSKNKDASQVRLNFRSRSMALWIST